MSDDPRRPDSQKSRQELLDEIYLLRDVAGEREQKLRERDQGIAERDEKLAERDRRIAAMQAELERIMHSRSWRLTSPLRSFTRLLRGLRRGEPPADAPDGGADDAGSAAPPPTVPGSPRLMVAVAPVETARSHQASASAIEGRQDRGPSLFVDITELALREGRTGVQRVTREILRALLAAPPSGYTVEPVVAKPGGAYCLAEGFATRQFEIGEPTASPGSPMDPRAGDVFLGLDHAMHAVVEHADELAAMREGGVRVWFVCNDTLPLAHPEWFPPDVHDRFKAWFETIARVASGVACISRATLTDVRHWLDALPGQRKPPPKLGCFHLGCDIRPDASAPTPDPDDLATIDRLRGMPSFLMVGTLEPRKGHAQALAAFQQLWARGEDVALVLAGLPGWMTEVTQRRIRHHDEFGRRLFWFMGAGDALLEKLYASCTVLLAPSKGEGFGLPLVEAARHRLPILCRDLPVFREVAGEYATYFSGTDPASLADAVGQWLKKHAEGDTPSSARMPRLSWAESAQQLLDAVLATAVDSANIKEGCNHS